jgi:hypothetical protein
LNVLAPASTRIVNLSLSIPSFPSSLKHAIFTPLLKKPSLDHEVLGNYRLVSHRFFLSKLVEKAVNFQLMRYLDANDLLPDRQSANRKTFRLKLLSYGSLTTFTVLLIGKEQLRFSFLTSAPLSILSIIDGSWIISPHAAGFWTML